MEMVFFRLPGHGDKTLKSMNSLRSRQHFCDITIVASNYQTFRGHKVVLAACSPFLRDQFLLNPSAKLQVSMLYSSNVLCDLLLSCYTGILQFKLEEIVNYLTAASYLQMEHIVERCRGALEKYVQLKNPTSPKMAAEESQATPVIVSGRIRSAAPPPQASQSSPASQHSPTLHSGEETSGEAAAHDGALLQDQHPILDHSCIKVNESEDEEESRQDGFNMFRVFGSEEEQSSRDPEEGGAPSDRCLDADFPETEGVAMAAESEEYEPKPAKEDLLSAEDVCAFRCRLSDSKLSRGRGRSRGRGLKRRKFASSQEKRSSGVSPQDLWYFANPQLGGGFGLDFGAEGLKAAGGYLPVELPPLDYGAADDPGDKVGGGLGHFSLEESGCGEGGSGLAGDESVAVVGSTSSGVGPVICEHCGVTFPSAHSLAVHSRSTHLLYSCPCCGKHFNHSGNLSRHMAVHQGAGKTHQCPLCYKTFTQKSTLIDHMNLHSGERPHRCAYCHARFAHKPALRRHLKEQHGKTTGQNSLHEQEERERAGAAGHGAEEQQDCVVTEEVSSAREFLTGN